MQGLWSDHFPAAAGKPTATNGADFPCKTKGLWSELFPAADTPPPPPPFRSQKCLICPKCNAATCRLITSRSEKNPNRQFYKCPADNGFIKWADEVHPNEFIDVPYCGGCSAGVCRVRRESRGPNAGRILFTCRVKEGEGSCGYRVWQDELERLATNLAEERRNSSEFVINCNDTASAPKTDLVEESNQTDEGRDIVSPVINSSEHLQCRLIISQKIGQSKCQEDKLNESSRRPRKRSRYADAKASDLLMTAHSLKVCLSVKSVPVENSWMADAICQNLSSQLHGWWGRLAFHPMPSLMTYLSESYSSLSSPSDFTFLVQGRILVDNNNIDPVILARRVRGVESYSKPLFNLRKCHNALECIPVMEDKILETSIDSTNLTRNLLGTGSHSKPLIAPVQCHDVPSCSEPQNKTLTHNVMSKSISNAFCQAAERLQNDLVTFLVTMDVKDHEAMSQAAEATFAALDRLLFDHQDFKKRVKDLIYWASLLSEIEQSMPTNDCYQNLVEKWSSERKKLEEINSVQAEAMDKLTNNKKRLKELQEEISVTMDWLFQIEAEISCCEVEMRSMELELDELSKNKEVLKGKYLIAFKELEESQKLFEQKQAELNTAKAAFDRARALLRGLT